MEKNTQKPNNRNYFTFNNASKSYINLYIYMAIAVISFAIFALFGAAIFNVDYKTFKEFPLVSFLYDMLTAISFFAVVVVLIKKEKINYPYALKLQKRVDPSKTLAVVVLSFTCVFLFSGVVNLLEFGLFKMGYTIKTELPFFISSSNELLIGIFLMALLPAVVEELVFRGIILNGFRTKFTNKQAVFFSALLFMLMHSNLQQTVYQLALGIIFGSIVIVSGNILYSIILHFMNNVIVVISNYIYVQNYGPVNPEDVSNLFTYSAPWDFIQPFVYLIIGVIIAYFVIMYLKNDSIKNTFKNIFYNIKNFKSKKPKESNIKFIETKTSEQEQPQVMVAYQDKSNIKFLSNTNGEEKYYFFLSIFIGILMLVLNIFLS